MFFVGLLALMTSAAFGQKESTGSTTKNKTNFQKGKLVKVEDAHDLGKTSEKGGYLLTIQDGASRYIGRYTLNYFQHDRSKEVSEGAEVNFRIDGKHLILKTPNGEEIKMRLCEQKGNCVRCGNMISCQPG